MNKISTPLVSIIIPCYGVEEYIEKCINSITAQTLNNIEIICINDGSPDNTINILKNLAAKDSRIQIIDKKNEGVSIARNIGIKQANGEYLLFVDPDDYIEKDTCEILYKKAIETDVDLVVCQFNFVDKYGNKKSNCVSKVEFNKPFIFSEKIIDATIAIPFYCWARLYKKSYIIDNNIFFPEELNIAEDCIFILKIFLNNPHILITNHKFYNYFTARSSSLSHMKQNVLLSKRREYIDYIEKICNSNKNKLNSTIVKLCFLDSFLASYCNKENFLIYSNLKKDYIKLISDTLELYKKNNNSLVNGFPGYRDASLLLLMTKLHLFSLYKFIFRPLAKYFIVKPYKLIKELSINNKKNT